MLAKRSILTIVLFAFSAFAGEPSPRSAPPQTPEGEVGQRLFFETRFAQAFFVQCQGNVNAPAIAGDPVLNETVTAGSNLPGPFAGKTMNCRACHLEDEQANVPGGGMRTYADFARRTPIPARADGLTTTVRNSMHLVNATLPRANFLIHFDGQFPSGPDLVAGTFTGRNFGWLPSESAIAVKHIANVIRGDDGSGVLAQQSGGSYAKVFAGDPSVPAQFRLSGKYVLDVSKASDSQILAAIGQLVTAYMDGLRFSTDASGAYNGSPYDLFLSKNNLPRKPSPGESDIAYARRLRTAVNALANPTYVGSADGQFTTHSIPFIFGTDELAGLQLFLAEPGTPAGQAGVGNCIACHAPPAFTDFNFHNIGVSQLEYDGIFGAGAFAQLKIPALAERKKRGADYLPPSAKHPKSAGICRAIPSANHPGQCDLGLWNVYANPDIPAPQRTLKKLLAGSFGKLNGDALLEKAIATFKTPGLRDLLDSQPYLHNGSLDDLGDAVNFHVQTAQMARNSQIRNADAALPQITLTSDQARQITAFLNALTEDFQDNF